MLIVAGGVVIWPPTIKLVPAIMHQGTHAAWGDAPPSPPTVDWSSASPEQAMEALKGLLMRAAA